MAEKMRGEIPPQHEVIAEKSFSFPENWRDDARRDVLHRFADQAAILLKNKPRESKYDRILSDEEVVQLWKDAVGTVASRISPDWAGHKDIDEEV